MIIACLTARAKSTKKDFTTSHDNFQHLTLFLDCALYARSQNWPKIFVPKFDQSV